MEILLSCAAFCLGSLFVNEPEDPFPATARRAAAIVGGGAKLADGSVFIETRPFRPVSDSFVFFPSSVSTEGNSEQPVDDEKKKPPQKRQAAFGRFVGIPHDCPSFKRKTFKYFTDATS